MHFYARGDSRTIKQMAYANHLHVSGKRKKRMHIGRNCCIELEYKTFQELVAQVHMISQQNSPETKYTQS
jgi:hypothetical protein